MKNNKIKEIIKDKRFKSIAFFTFYIVFFAIIISMLRNTTTNKSTTTSSSDALYSLNSIKQINYHFKYTINNNIFYEGDRNKDKSMFTKTENNNIESYYSYLNLFLKKDNDTWVKATNPIYYSEFTNIDNISSVLKSASYEAKTLYKDDTKSYTYLISTTTLFKIIDNKDIDIEDIANKITITTDKYNDVFKIEYDLTPYYQYKMKKIDNLLLKLEYSDFNNIKEIDTPKVG